MKVHRLLGLSVVLAIISTLSVTPARAATPTQAEVDGLRKAYLNLVAGNHDYKGHRVAALKHVEKASQLLGLNISGDGKAKQQQRNSDSDLAAAKAALEGVLDIAKAQNQPQIVTHVTTALKEINIALSIK